MSLARLGRRRLAGVLSCDGLSSAAYGTEEILYALLPFFGLAAFTLVLPLTLVVLFGVLLVVLSYREPGPAGRPGRLDDYQWPAPPPGTRIRLHGTVGIGADGHPAMINPAYELLT